MIASTSTAPVSQGGGTPTATLGGKDKNYTDFLKLLTTQLQNQDPTAPTDTNQLTQQIATLSQVEQQLATNEKLDKLIGMYSGTQSNAIIGFIGKQVEAAGDSAILTKGKADFTYNLEKAASSVVVTIRNEDGDVVRTDESTGLSKFAGSNTYKWDGLDNQGNIAATGKYTISVEARTASGAAIAATGSDAALKNGTAKYVYYMSQDAAKVTVTIKDSTGQVVRKDMTGGTKLAGRNLYEWNGKNDLGNTMPAGTYKIEIAATDANNQEITVKTFMIGVVTSVDSVNGQTFVSIGEMAIPMANVSSISLAPQNQI